MADQDRVFDTPEAAAQDAHRRLDHAARQMNAHGDAIDGHKGWTREQVEAIRDDVRRGLERVAAVEADIANLRGEIAKLQAEMAK